METDSLMRQQDDGMATAPFLRLLSVSTNKTCTLFALYEQAVAKRCSLMSGQNVKIYRDFDIQASYLHRLRGSHFILFARRIITTILHYWRGLKTLIIYPGRIKDLWLLSIALVARNGNFARSRFSVKYSFVLIYAFIQLVRDLGRYALLAKIYDIALIDHACYATGVAFIAFALQGKKIAMNSFPHGLVVLSGLRKKTCYPTFVNKLFNIKDSLTLDDSLLQDFDSIIKTFHGSAPDALPYMVKHQWIDSNARPFEKFHPNTSKFIIYTHSFTDAQNYFGYDGAFNDVYEWLDFTINFLSSSGVSIIVKAHPSFFANKDTVESTIYGLDRKIYEELYAKYKSITDIEWINYPMPNSDLLKFCDPSKTVAISHHGSSLIEAALSGYKCISSSCASWAGFEIFNEWNSKLQYTKVLNMDTQYLKRTNLDNLKVYLKYYYCSQSSYFHPNHFEELLAREIGVTRKWLIHNHRSVATILESLGHQRCEDIANLLSINSVSELLL